MKKNFEDYVTELAPSLAAADKPRWFLLTCMDYRYAHRIVDVMDSKGLRGKYDVFVLAGAAAGANKEQTWREAFVTHVKTARKLKHPIDRIIILEHRDCGAYQEFFGLVWADVKPPIETEKHLEQVMLLIPYLKNELQNPEYPELKVDSFLLARDEDDELVIEGHHHS
jgi:carbonic anhydrase